MGPQDRAGSRVQPLAPERAQRTIEVEATIDRPARPTTKEENMKLNKTSCAFALAGLLSVLALPVSAAQTPAAPATTLAGAADSSSAYFLLHHPRALAKFLNLSAAQTTQTVAFYNTFQQTVEPIHQARIPLCAQLITDLNATPPQPETVGTDAINLANNRQQRLAARKAFDTSFSAILNPSQLAAYNALKTLAQFSDPEINVIGDCPRP
jgi:Spy/CpxP family protein refolding chaperone